MQSFVEQKGSWQASFFVTDLKGKASKISLLSMMFEHSYQICHLGNTMSNGVFINKEIRNFILGDRISCLQSATKLQFGKKFMICEVQQRKNTIKQSMSVQ